MFKYVVSIKHKNNETLLSWYLKLNSYWRSMKGRYFDSGSCVLNRGHSDSNCFYSNLSNKFSMENNRESDKKSYYHSINVHRWNRMIFWSSLNPIRSNNPSSCKCIMKRIMISKNLHKLKPKCKKYSISAMIFAKNMFLIISSMTTNCMFKTKEINSAMQ